MKIKLTPFASILCLAVAATAHAAEDEVDPEIQALFPIPGEVREIIDSRCVFCHGEVIDGEAEIREDLDMSTDEAFRSTLGDIRDLEELIAEDEMPHEAKLSRRLRRDPDMQARLAKIQEDYEANGEKEKLLAWIHSAIDAE